MARIQRPTASTISTHIATSVMKIQKLLLLMAIVAGSLSTARAQPANMLRFDGNNDFIELGNLLPSGSYTKEVWISAGFFGASTGSLIAGRSTNFMCPNGRLRAGHSIGNVFTDVEAPIGFTMNPNTWYHLAVTYDVNTNILTLYQDGVQVAQGPATGTYSETGLFIGGFNPNPDPNSPYEGRLDEVRIWNVARTPAEIANTRLCALTGDEPGLVAYYDFEQGIPDGNNPTETILFDRRDNCTARNGTLFNFALAGGSSNWSGPGAEIFFSGTCATGFPNLRIDGNGLCIVSGDNTPSAGDHTFFEGAASRSFTLLNTGGANLDITDVTITGTGAAQFSIATPPAASVSPGGSTTLTISRALVAGTHEATVTITNSDPNEPAYSFDIETNVVLDVQLTQFHAMRQGNTVSLTWTTASEHDNLGFRVMRSFNSADWTEIGFVAGAGNSNVPINYSFIDPSPHRGTNYYRLEIVANTHNTSLSNIESVRFFHEHALIYPVPVRDDLTIEVAAPGMIGSSATIIDLNGKTVHQFNISALKQQVSVRALPSGVYVLRLEDGEAHRFIKQ